MPLESLELTVILPGTPDRIYEAWLDSRGHAAFTGSAATIDPIVGGTHSAWDGYITGKNLALEPGRRIHQTWRTTEFPDDAADSSLELLFEAADGGTRLVLRHTNIPEGQSEQYQGGWRDYYFNPMQEYFASLAVSPAVAGAPRVVAPKVTATTAARKAPAKKASAKRKAPAKKANAKTAAKKKPAKKKPAAKKKAKAGKRR